MTKMSPFLAGPGLSADYVLQFVDDSPYKIYYIKYTKLAS